MRMIFRAEPPPCDGVGAGLGGTAAGTGDAGAGAAAMAGSAAEPGMAAPHFEQNLTPGAIGEPQFPQNPGTYHLHLRLEEFAVFSSGLVGEKNSFAPPGLFRFRLSHGLRRGLHSCAASRLRENLDTITIK